MSEMEENFIHTKYGYCYYEYEQGNVPIIFNLYVHPEYRRTGQAKKILSYVVGQIRSLGYQGKITIEATPREQSISRDALKAFYESMGLLVVKSSPINKLAAENERLKEQVRQLIGWGNLLAEEYDPNNKHNHSSFCPKSVYGSRRNLEGDCDCEYGKKYQKWHELVAGIQSSEVKK